MYKRIGKKPAAASASSKAKVEAMAPTSAAKGQLPPGHIYGYHKTRSNINIHNIAYNGFTPKKGNSIYGDGFYMCRDFITHINRSGYGDFMIESFVDMSNVLILDPKLSVEIWGVNKSVMQQVVEKNIKVNSLKDQNTIKSWSQLCQSLDHTTAETFKKMYDTKLLDLTHWSGVAYTGSNDGPCILMFDTDLVYPQRWTNASEESIIDAVNSYVKQILPSWKEGDKNRYYRKYQRVVKDKPGVLDSHMLWHGFNQKEMLRVRAGLTPRFYQFLEHIKKNPATAERRFYYMLSRMDYSAFHQFFDVLSTTKNDNALINSLLTAKMLPHMRKIFNNSEHISEAIDLLRNHTRRVEWIRELGKAYSTIYFEDAKKRLIVDGYSPENVIEVYQGYEESDVIQYVRNYDDNYLVQKDVNDFGIHCLRQPGIVNNNECMIAILSSIKISGDDAIIEPVPVEPENIILANTEFDEVSLLKEKEPAKAKKSKTKAVPTEDDDVEEEEDDYSDDDDDEDEEEL